MRQGTLKGGFTSVTKAVGVGGGDVWLGGGVGQ